MLKVRQFETKKMEMGEKSTPQGPVISPLLFNTAMVDLSRDLAKFQGIGHTIYADDITVRCAGGSDGQVKAALQEAVNTTGRFPEDTGLQCFLNK